MSDTWDMQNKQEQSETAVPPVTEETAAQQSAVPSEPTQETAAPSEPSSQPAAEPAQPATPPLNGWSSDGSYRYVPPRTGQDHSAPPPPYQNPVYGQNGYAPNQPRYQSPAGGYSWTPSTPPTGGYGATPPTGQKPPRKKRGWIAAVAILGALAVVACVVVVAYASALFINGDTPLIDLDSSVVDSGDASANENAPSLEIDTWDTNDGGLSAEEIVNRNYDSTVVITVYSQSNSFNFGESNLTEAGGSTGIVMSKDGYIITNWHCVINENTGKKYDRIDVTTYDGKTYEDAQVIGADEATDLAVIQVDADNLTPAEFGDSDELAVGARVVALGNAAGLSWTATQGIVSARARDVYDDTGYAIKCLQVDAAINYGNSGGPLLNKQGLVVGINSAKIAASGYEGLGFSIPINEAKVIIDSLLKYGYVKGRVALGITGQTVSSGVYKGFMIISIDEGSSLEGSGAATNDLIVEVDGVTITDYGTLRAELAKHQVGDQVTLKLLRSDRRTGQVSSYTIKVTLKEQTAG